MGKYLYIIFVFLLLTTAAGQSRESVALGLDDSVVVMKAAVVTAPRPVKELNLYASEPTQISRLDIERSGAATVTEVLQNTIPGMIFTPNAMGNNMRVRGLSSRYVLILVNGQRLAPEGAGGNVNLDRVAVGDIERIDVASGAAGTLWGAGAMGGVINIITRHDSGVRAVAEAGSHGTFRTAAAVGLDGINRHDLGGQLSLAPRNWCGNASVFRNSSAGFEGTIAGAPYTDWGAAARVGHTPGKRTTLDANVRFFSHETFNRKGTLNTTHKLAHSWSAGAGAKVSGKHTVDIRLNTDNYIDYNVLELLKNQRRRQNRNSVTELRAVDKFKTMTFGIDASRETAFASTTLGNAPTSLAVNQGAIFVQNTWHFTKRVHALSNAAVEVDKIMGGITAGGRYTLSSQFGSTFSPSVSALWNPSRRITIEGGANMAFRPPTIKELHYDFDHQGMFWIFGNPALKPERGLYSHLSMSYNAPKVNAALTLYRNDIRNKITQYYVSAASAELHYKNVGSATLQGVEIDTRAAIGGRVMAQATYTFCDAVDNTSGQQLDSNPRHSFAGSITWFTWRNWLSVQLGGRRTSALRTLSTMGTANRVGAQTVARAAITREWRCGFSAGVRVENIFDYRSVLTPEGRTLFITLKYKL